MSPVKTGVMKGLVGSPTKGLGDGLYAFICSFSIEYPQLHHRRRRWESFDSFGCRRCQIYMA